MQTFSGADEFKRLTDTILASYKGLFPVEKNGHKIEATSVWLDEKSTDPQDFADQKKTKLNGGTWGVPVMASLVLKDPTGKVVDRIEKIRIATVPRLTPRRSYIVGGNEYQVPNQMIRKPGAYIIPSQKGDTFKGMIALRGDSQKNFDLQFDPENNKYTVDVGQAKMGLFPLLKSLGATDQELVKTFGEDVFAANKAKDKDSTYLQLAQKIANVTTDNKQTAIESIQNFAKSTKTDGSVTEITLGKKYDGLNKGLILDTAKKLLQVYRGEKEADDPENLVFKEIRSVEDMLHDRLANKKENESLKNMLKRHLGNRADLKKMIDFRKLTAPVETFFTTDNRTSTPEQYNPIHILSEASKLTVHGTGGIESEHAVTNHLREVHPSHIGFVDPMFTPESDKTGTVVHLASGVEKQGRDIHSLVFDLKSGKTARFSPKEMYYKVVAFPDEFVDGKFKNPSNVRVQSQGRVFTTPASKVDAVLPTPIGMFAHATNMIPFLKNNQGARASMASKMLGQALPLVEREAPLVQTELQKGTTFQKAVGSEFSLRAPKSGTVKAVTADHIIIDDKKIPLYNNFPLNQKTHLHHEALVKVGDKVKEGQLIADTNFTKGGDLALGKNMTVAYLPIPGHTFEDGIVITESAAKKLAAEQIYKHNFRTEAGKSIVDLKKWIGYYGAKLGKEAYAQLDTEGVVKKGTVVKPGSVLIAGLQNNINSPENMTLKRINKSLMLPWADSSVTYKGEFPGVVTDVVKKGDGVQVFVKTVEPARESDKLSGVHGNKGVISKVIPDHEAPKRADGTVPDIFLNPHGIIGRINLGQLYESAAGKMAKKTGKPYIVKNFEATATNRKIVEELKKAGVSDTEVLYDPSGKKLGEVHVGNPYILRLAKTGKSGFSARIPGTGYDNNLQPLKGGEEGTKTLDPLTFYSMLSHGAKKNLIDAHQKSEKNDEFWHAVETGKPVPAPKPTFAFEKFVSLIKGSGVNVEKKGSDFVLAPMTDKEIKKISKGQIKEPQFFYGKNEKPIAGGLYDESITGGLTGKNYAHIELPERMPNPVFESAIKSLTGLKNDQYTDMVAGKLFINKAGQIVNKKEAGAVTGGEAVAKLLSKIDVDSELSKSKTQLKSLASKDAPDTDIDRVNRKVRYLTALKELNMTPEEAYTRTLVPVIPPVFRPVQEIQGVGRSVAPTNYLYQSVGLLSKAHDYPVMKLLEDSEKEQLRTETYKATRALAGLEPVLTRGKDQPIEGFIKQITGDSPKTGFFLNKLLTKKQDLVGRGVITNGPDLHVDQIGIPEKMAWKIFRPFIIRQFVMSGFKPEEARKEVDQQTPRAHDMLQVVMKQRTVLMNRAPSLHKFSVMGFKPTLTDGLAIKVPPLVFKGFNADIDGDAVNIHVPVSDEAVKESLKMFPSNNLWKPGTGELMLVPSQEASIGLYFLSQTPEGRKKINQLLPAKYHVQGKLDAKAAKDLFNNIAKNEPTQFANLVGQLKSLGDNHAYGIGFSASLKDLVVDTKARDAVFAKADKAVAKLMSIEKPGAKRDEKVANLYEAAAKEAYQTSIKKQLRDKGSAFYHMVESGARGKDLQLQQLVSAPGILQDAKDRKVPVPVKNSYAEGLTTSDYFISAYGVRKGMMDRSLQTSKPGALNKEILATSVDNIVTLEDCGTKRGANIAIERQKDLYGRYLASDVGGFKRNQPVSPQVISALRAKGIKTVPVRSPLGCVAPKGTCAHCYGVDETDKRPELGDNVGAKMGQTMSEPVTQFVMRCSVGTVIVRHDNQIYSRSMDDLFDLLPGDVEVEGNVETKKVAGLEIWDKNGWTEAYQIQRHPPEVPMNFIKTRTGDALLVQQDHPMFTYQDQNQCCEKPTHVVRHENRNYTTSECIHCKRVGTIEKKTLVNTMVEKPVSEIVAGKDHLWVSYWGPSHKAESPSVDPYALGFYAAEGCSRVGNGTELYKDRVVAVSFSQYECHSTIKDYLETRLVGWNYKRYDKEIAIYDAERAGVFKHLVPGHAVNKRLNFDFLFMDRKYLGDLLSGMIDGDGTVGTAKGGGLLIKYYTSSFLLAQQVGMICRVLGIQYSTSICSRNTERSKIKHTTQPFSVEIRPNHNGLSWLRACVKLNNKEVDADRRTYANYYGITEVNINQEVEVHDGLLTYDIQTKTKGYMCGFLRNHNTFHTGGVSGGATVSGFNRVNQLLSMPKYVAGEAATAPIAGKVSKIEKSSAGGLVFTINDKKITARPGMAAKVKVGDTVAPGDALSEGVLKPQVLAKTKGMAAAQDYIVDELQKTYAQQGVDMHRKVFETVVRSLANNTRVIEAPKHTALLPGDMIPYTLAQHYNANRRVAVPVADSVGYFLEKPVGKLPAMHEIRSEDVSYLKSAGISGKIEVLKDPLRHMPVLKSIKELPMMRKDWMSQFGFQKIKTGLTEGAAQAWKSNVEGTHPVPAFAYGATFGKKKESY